jgi:predicted Zn-dependent peptidase
MSAALRITRLESGLTVASEAMPRVETVSVGAYVSVGTRHEEAAENGISHFLEHMAFKGTERRTAADIAREVEAVGGHINAYTAREQTAYYLKLLKEDLSLGVDILGDILCHSVFLPEEIERERGVILQEIGQANDTPDDIVFDHFQETAFPDQPMGWPTLGREAIIRTLGRERLRAYMRRHYTPSRMVIAAAGAVDHDALVALVRRHFADLPATVAGSSARRASSIKCISCSASPASPMAIPTITRGSSSPPCSAGGCRRASSRRCAKSAASSIRSIRSPSPIATRASLASMPGREQQSSPSSFR